MQKIIFLDIDGPMIPYTNLLLDKGASLDQKLDDRCVQVLYKILKKSGSKIVFNSYHNTALRGPIMGINKLSRTPGLIERFRQVGLAGFIHESESTDFPYGGGNGAGGSSLTRLEAIKKWLFENGNANWVALDDEYIDHPRAYQVDCDYGIGIREYSHCADWLWLNPGKKDEYNEV